MYTAAVMADEGLGTARDASLALKLHRKAAESGLAAAMVRLSEDCVAAERFARRHTGDQPIKHRLAMFVAQAISSEADSEIPFNRKEITMESTWFRCRRS